MLTAEHFAAKNVIDACLETRSWTASSIAELFLECPMISEERFASKVSQRFSKNPKLFNQGWYSPPPLGVAALFSDSTNKSPESKSPDFKRLQFETLREKTYWPRDHYYLGSESAGIIYASPVHKETLAIGDFGLTIYRGDDLSVQAHLKSCLGLMESAAELAELGMEFRELHNLAQSLFKTASLHNQRTATWTDKTGTNLGHTIPWTNTGPSPEELVSLNSSDFNVLKDAISNSRIYVNGSEKFQIPENIAFTIEARLESLAEPAMPNTFFHLIIAFRDGKRSIHADFSEVFASLGMDRYLVTKY